MNAPREYDVVIPPTSLEVASLAHEVFDPASKDRTMSIMVLGRHVIPKPTAENIDVTVNRITVNDDGTRSILGRSALSELVLITTSSADEEKATATVAG